MANTPHRQVDAECCPTCKSRRISSDPEQAGEIYRCDECGHRLSRLKREGIFGEQYYYVDVNRAGLEVHKVGRQRNG